MDKTEEVRRESYATDWLLEKWKRRKDSPCLSPQYAWPMAFTWQGPLWTRTPKAWGRTRSAVQ